MQPPLPLPFKVPLFCFSQRTQYLQQKKKKNSPVQNCVASRRKPTCRDLGMWFAISSLSKWGPFIRRDLCARSTSIRCLRLNNVPLSCCHMDALWSILQHAWAGPCWCWPQCEVMHERYFLEPVKRRLKNVYKEWPAVTGKPVGRCSHYSSA